MRGIFYGVGVGPGDPELITQKAARLIMENDIIAVPGKDAVRSAAYRIAAEAVPQIAQKQIVPVIMPMTRDEETLAQAHRKAAGLLESYLDKGMNVVYLVLGDPSIYSTFGYLRDILLDDGYDAETVPAVTSFCAAAARLNINLAEGEEVLHIVPASGDNLEVLDLDGNCVLMKSASGIPQVKERLSVTGRKVIAVENCGMDGEKIYYGVSEIPDDAGYYTLIIAKQD